MNITVFKFLFIALLACPIFFYGQDIQFRLCGNTNSCGFSILNLAGSNLFRIGGNGSFSSLAPFYINAPVNNDTIMVVKRGNEYIIASAYDEGGKTHIFGELSIDTIDANVTTDI